MAKFFIGLLFVVLFFGCQPVHNEAPVPVTVDPDIVLINLGEGNREFIGKVLRKIDSLNPIAVGIDITFQGRKNNDTALISALAKLKNDVLVYNVKANGQITGSDSVFTKNADTGNLYYEQKFGLITTIIPFQKINDQVYESFAVKIIKKWQPDFVSKIRENEKIDIHYTRDQKKYFELDGAMLIDTKAADFDLKNKIFLVGYLGPENKDKHFTPLRNKSDNKSNEPDTYGVVIIANEIRTILEYGKK